MAKASTDIRSLARSHTETAVNTLAGIMREKGAPHAARVSAAQALLDRGWGKAVQAISGPEGGPLQIEVVRFAPFLSPQETGICPAALSESPAATT